MNAGFRLVLVALTCLPPLVAISQSEGDTTAGHKLATQRCVYCHGPDGNGNRSSYMYQRGEIPRIAGLPAPYFLKSMYEFKNKQRPQGDMQTVAEQLSDQNIRDVAAWYAGRPLSATATYDSKMQ